MQTANQALGGTPGVSSDNSGGSNASQPNAANCKTAAAGVSSAAVGNGLSYIIILWEFLCEVRIPGEKVDNASWAELRRCLRGRLNF